MIGMSETLILAELSSGVELVNSRSRNCPKSRERESWIGVPTVPPYQTAYPYRSAPLAHVRFAPESRLQSDIAPCPLCAKTGLVHRSKPHRYSITSSTVASSDGGTSRPSALAVLRLVANSNLVGDR